MNNKIISIVLIVTGIALIIWGYNIYDAIGSQLSRSLSGDISIKAWVGMIGGAIAFLAGVSKIK